MMVNDLHTSKPAFYTHRHRFPQILMEERKKVTQTSSTGQSFKKPMKCKQVPKSIQWKAMISHKKQCEEANCEQQLREFTLKYGTATEKRKVSTKFFSYYCFDFQVLKALQFEVQANDTE